MVYFACNYQISFNYDIKWDQLLTIKMPISKEYKSLYDKYCMQSSLYDYLLSGNNMIQSILLGYYSIEDTDCQ